MLLVSLPHQDIVAISAFFVQSVPFIFWLKVTDLISMALFFGASPAISATLKRAPGEALPLFPVISIFVPVNPLRRLEERGREL